MKFFADLVKLFQKFIYRDLLYFVSGCVVAFSSIVLLETLGVEVVSTVDKNIGKLSGLFIIPSLVILYVTGFLLQELFSSIIKFVSTLYNNPLECWHKKQDRIKHKLADMQKMYDGNKKDKLKMNIEKLKRKEIIYESKKPLILKLLIRFNSGSEAFWKQMPRNKDYEVTQLWKMQMNLKKEEYCDVINRITDLMHIGSALAPGFLVSSVIFLFNLFFSILFRKANLQINILLLTLSTVFLFLTYLVYIIKNSQCSLLYFKLGKGDFKYDEEV